jgi:L-alanine-DL-glutamate epimerase-like enolase superfamily enzyme
VLTELQSDGVTGYGEAALPTAGRYGETPETVVEFLSNLRLEQFDDPFLVEDILAYVDGTAPGNNAAKASVDIALHDWLGKKLGVPIYRLFGLNKNKTPITTITIGIDKPEVMQQKVLEAEDFPVLKIKVGLENDEEIMAAVRQVTKKPLRVDANEGWKSKELALERIQWLETQGVEFVEQPMPSNQFSDIAWLRERVKIPLIADESVMHLEDIPKLKAAFDGINLKLMKCAGIRQGLMMIHAARAMGMKIMMGCMIESSVAIAAAIHLSPLIDYADLDGNLLVTNDPFEGVKVSKGKLILGDGPGLGVKLR